MPRFGYGESITMGNVSSGAIALLSPLLNAGFDVAKAQQEASAEGKSAILERKRQQLLNPQYIPEARKPLSYSTLIFIILMVVIIIIIVLGVFAGTTAKSSSKLGIIASKTTASGKTRTIRRIRKEPTSGNNS